VATNSYITVLGTLRYAATRVKISQGFQGVTSFVGPLIVSSYFFKGKNATALNTVHWVAVAISGIGVVLNVLFL
jgi:fucose permease